MLRAFIMRTQDLACAVLASLTLNIMMTAQSYAAASILASTLPLHVLSNTLVDQLSYIDMPM